MRAVDDIDLCEECGIVEGEMVLSMPDGDIFVCRRCEKKLRKHRKKVNHGQPPVE
jgi:uncharacterized paraquat-inducible protein A